MAGGQAGGGDLKPLRHSDWPSRRKGAWPLLTMRCKDPTTFQSPRPRPRATPRLLGCGLLVLSATPPSQLLKRPLQSSGFRARCWGICVSDALLEEKAQWFRPTKPGRKMEKPNWVRGSYGISCLEPSALYKSNADVYLDKKCVGAEPRLQSVRHGTDLGTG